MCGIVGYVGSATEEQAGAYVLEGLSKLEYRGYDSAGIASIHQGQILLKRCAGKLRVLSEALHKNPLPGRIALGHTRWATHGKPCEENAHPHLVEDIVVVHNGIIENYLELKAALAKEGRVFKSETDTEIVAHLISRAKAEGYTTLVERVRRALQQIHGAYALAVMALGEPDTLVVARNASPLVIGVLEQAGLIASDIPALLPYTREIIVLGEEELAVIKPGVIQITALNTGKEIQRAKILIDWSPVMAEKDGHKHFMHKEIHEQPRALLDTLRGVIGPDNDHVELNGVLKELALPKRLLFTACGTSYHAALVGRLAIEELARIPTEVELASELRYRPLLFAPDTLVVAISQSGETADTLAAIKAAKQQGAKVLAIVNVVGSSIARLADLVLYTKAGPEIGVASTKAFVTQVITLILLALGLAESKQTLARGELSNLLNSLRQLPLHIESILKNEAHCLKIAHKLKDAHSVLYMGRGYGYPVALEGALKLKEISYIHAEGYAAGELKHGPIALVEARLPVIVIATAGILYEKILANIQEVVARSGEVIAIATLGDERIKDLVREVIYVPEVPPILAALVAIIPLQLLAYHVADLRGTDVDQPRNLAKSVTVE